MSPDLCFKGCLDFSFPVCAAVHQFLDNALTRFPGRYVSLQFHGCQIPKTFKVLIRYLVTSHPSHVNAEKLYTTTGRQGILFLNYAKKLDEYYMNLTIFCHLFLICSVHNLFHLHFDLIQILCWERLEWDPNSKTNKQTNKNRLLFLLSSYISLVLAPRCASQISCCDTFQKRIYCFYDDIEELMI